MLQSEKWNSPTKICTCFTHGSLQVLLENTTNCELLKFKKTWSVKNKNKSNNNIFEKNYFWKKKKKLKANMKNISSA